MNSFELITKFLPEAVDKYFVQDAKTAILENGSKYIDVSFKEAGYVKVASFLMDGLSDYYKVQEEGKLDANYANYAGNVNVGARDGFDIGGVDLKWEIFRLQFVRGRQFRIDAISNEETASVTLGNLLEEFHRVKVIPEVDTVRFSIIADSCSSTLGNLVEGTPTDTDDESGIIHLFNAGFKWLTDHEVPEEEQVIFVSPATMQTIRNTKELYKHLTQDEYDTKNGNGVTFSFKQYEGRPIIEVPSSRFFTKAITTKNGYSATDKSKSINFMICSKKAVIPIRKVEYSKVFAPEVVQDYYGYKINYLLYHGVVIPDNKVVGSYTSVSDSVTATTTTNVLEVDLREGTQTNGWVMKLFNTMPSGLRGRVVRSAAPKKIGAKVVVDGDTIKLVEKGIEQIDASASQYYFSLIDDRNNVIAASKQITLPKKVG